MIKTCLAALALVISGAIAQATTITLSFNANSTFNPGAPGPGLTTGEIVLSTDGSSSLGAGLHLNVFSSINFTVNGLLVQSMGMPSIDRLFQVDLALNADGFNATYAGGFAPTGGEFEIAEVGLEIVFAPGVNFFNSIDDLFSGVSPGQQFTLEDIDRIGLDIHYVGQSVINTTILSFNDTSDGNDTVSNEYVPDSMLITVSAVPVPPGLGLLMAGFGGLALLRRRGTRAAL